MLDIKHKNIGATVSMLKLIHKITDGEELPTEITKLFMVESGECDYKHESGACVFNGSLETNLNCCIGECPLGSMVDKELKDSPGLPSIGPCAGCGGRVDMDNVAHVDDDMQICKSCFDEKENMKS